MKKTATMPRQAGQAAELQHPPDQEGDPQGMEEEQVEQEGEGYGEYFAS